MNERKNPVQTGIDVSYAQGKINWEEAVSYTHLDVYKRQILLSP